MKPKAPKLQPFGEGMYIPNYSGIKGADGAIKNMCWGDGSEAAPSIYMCSDTDTGFYHYTLDNQWAFTAGGTWLMVWSGQSPPTISVNGRVAVNDGSKESPTFAFRTAGDNGFYYKTTDTVGACSNSVDIWNWNETTFNLDKGINFTMAGSTSGVITHSIPATVTSHTLTWPSAQGASSTYLKNDGSGNLSWATVSGGEAFPVGAVFISVVSTNPNTLLGYGTWSAIGAGRVLVGLDSGDTDFDTVEETGGAKTVASSGEISAESSHTHTYTDVIKHTHTLASILRTATTGADTTIVAQAIDTSSTANTVSTVDETGSDTGTTSAGSSHTHTYTGSATSVVQPYFVVYMWKRTA